MWVMGVLNGRHVYFSASTDDEHERIMVRTRTEIDAHRIARFLDEPIVATPDGDYEWRVFTTQENFEKLTKQIASEVNYRRFKPTIPDAERWRYVAYLDCWEALLPMRHHGRNLREAA